MKKLILLIFTSLFLASCFGSGSDDNLQKAKEDLLNGNSATSNSGNLLDSDKITKAEENREKFEKKSEQFIEEKYLTEDEFIKLDSLNILNFENLQKEITGTTLVNVDKIIVKFSNPTSPFPDDTFELKKFKAGDKTFLYRAFKKYETLDYGLNTYIFEAYSGEKVSKIELKVNILKPEVKPVEPISDSKLPSSSQFGNPVDLGNGKITYSDIKGLEIENVGDLNLKNDSDSVTEFLKEKYNTIFYWNTKRPIYKTYGLSFFVVRVVGNKYIYEKNYYVPKVYGENNDMITGVSLYATLRLEEGDFDDKLSLDEKIKKLSELNLELREKNNTFTLVPIADSLFEYFFRS